MTIEGGAIRIIEIDSLSIEEHFKKASRGDHESREIVSMWFEKKLQRAMRHCVPSSEDA